MAQQQAMGVDGLLPAKIMQPGDAEDAARQLLLCDRSGACVVVWGGGTQMGLGSPPRRYDVAFSTQRMTRLLEYEPGDLTCRVEAGMPVGQLQSTLRGRGQRLPLDPPHPERATVGGMVAANTNGLNRARHGTVRDWVIGIAVAYPSGKVARAGGKVVKNVAGYDLMKLHTGALGTLGVVVEVNLKVQTMPEADETLLAHFEDPGAALKAGIELAHQYLAPAAMVLMDRTALWKCGLTADWRWTLALKLEGYAREIEPARQAAGSIIRAADGRLEGSAMPEAFWDQARDWAAPVGESEAVLYGVTSLTGLKSLVPVATEAGSCMVQPAAGVFHVRVPVGSAATAVERLRHAAGDAGQVVIARAPAALKQTLDVWGAPPPSLQLMRSIKAALDPKGILSPGRFVGGI
ncbi:MAG TPA: FAD-binding oxidoreductase [Candidatus Dormibacteraeota bacterium]